MSTPVLVCAKNTVQTGIVFDVQEMVIILRLCWNW